MKLMNYRYYNHILFKGIGREGQERLSGSRILLVGCGALGASHAEMLTRAGVGFLRIVDRDFVELSNLQRQTLYSEADANKQLPKAIAAQERLSKINSEVKIDAVIADVNHLNIEEFIKDVYLVLDGTDNFQIRYLINDVCVKHEKTWIYGAAVSSYGTSMTIIPHKTPCLRCIFEEIPSAGSSPTCETEGIIHPIISIISSIQISEALKILVAEHDLLHNSLIQIDTWENDWRKIKLGKPNSDCKACGQKEFEFLEAKTTDSLISLCGRNAVQINPSDTVRIDLASFARNLNHLDILKLNGYLCRLKIDKCELTIFQDGRAIISGTDDPSVARSIYAKYVGN